MGKICMSKMYEAYGFSMTETSRRRYILFYPINTYYFIYNK